MQQLWFLLFLNLDLWIVDSILAGSAESRCWTIVFLHGAPTQSYSYRVVMSKVVRLNFLLDLTVYLYFINYLLLVSFSCLLIQFFHKHINSYILVQERILKSNTNLWSRTWLANYLKAGNLLPVNQQGGLHQVYFPWFTFF